MGGTLLTHLNIPTPTLPLNMHFLINEDLVLRLCLSSLRQAISLSHVVLGQQNDQHSAMMANLVASILTRWPPDQVNLSFLLLWKTFLMIVTSTYHIIVMPL